jgi:hypothetical protein
MAIDAPTRDEVVTTAFGAEAEIGEVTGPVDDAEMVTVA